MRLCIYRKKNIKNNIKNNFLWILKYLKDLPLATFSAYFMRSERIWHRQLLFWTHGDLKKRWLTGLYRFQRFFTLSYICYLCCTIWLPHFLLSADQSSQYFFQFLYVHRLWQMSVHSTCKWQFYINKKTTNTCWLLLIFHIPSKLHTRNIFFHPTYHIAWSCPRPISISQLHTLLYFHLWPIYLVVFKGSYYLRRDISSWGGLHA